MGFFDFWTDTIGVDCGTQSLRIIKDGELIFNERSIISFDKEAGVFSGLGNSVRTTHKYAVFKPVNYAIWDFHAFEMLLRGAVKKGSKSNWAIPKSCIIYFCIPTGISEVEKRAYRDSGQYANGKEVYLVDQSYCAAIGLNILFTVKNFILIDFSSSKIEICVFADSQIIALGSLRLGTWKVYDLVKNYFHRAHKIELSEKEIDDLMEDLENSKESGEIKVQFKAIRAKEIQSVLEHYFNPDYAIGFSNA